MQRLSLSAPATVTASPTNSISSQSHNIGSSSNNRLQSTSEPPSENSSSQSQPDLISQKTMTSADTSITLVEAPDNDQSTVVDMEMPNADTTHEVNIITQPDSNSEPHDATNVITTDSDTTSDVVMKPPKTPKGRRSKKTKATSPPATTLTKRGKVILP